MGEPICLKRGEGERERNEERMKLTRPPDQGVRNKGGPVCSTQRQTEPVGSFVPQNFSITKRILLSCFHSFTTTPSTPCPPLKRATLTFGPPLFKLCVIQNQPAGFLLFSGVVLISDILLSSPLSHDDTIQGLERCRLMKR